MPLLQVGDAVLLLVALPHYVEPPDAGVDSSVAEIQGSQRTDGGVARVRTTNAGLLSLLGVAPLATGGDLSNSGTLLVGSGSLLDVNGNYVQLAGVLVVS
jgi:hypothetical protein